MPNLRRVSLIAVYLRFTAGTTEYTATSHVEVVFLDNSLSPGVVDSVITVFDVVLLNYTLGRTGELHTVPTSINRVADEL